MGSISTSPDLMKQELQAGGWVDGEILAAGQLRQGKAPSTAAMVTGAALFEVMRPRRSKLLPRHFVLVVTAEKVVAFKASGGSPEDSSDYELNIKPGEEASYPRASVSISELAEGAQSKGGTMTIDGESFPVARPNLNGDVCTDELLAALSGPR